MLLYLLLLLLVIISSYIISFSKNKVVVFYFKIITILLLALPAMLRYGIGIDYYNYIDIFNLIKIYGFSDVEIGYTLLNKFIANLGGDGQFVLAIMALITVLVFFKDLDDNKWIIFAPFFILVIYEWYFTTVRQIFAMSLVFYAWNKAEKNEYFKALIAILIGYTFHSSTIIYPFCYLAAKYINIREGVMLVFVVCFYLIFDYLFYYVENIINLLFGTFGGKYEVYTSSEEWYGKAKVGTGYLSLLRKVNLLILMFSCFLVKIKNKKFYNILSLYLIIERISMNILIFGRINRSLLFVIPLAIWSIYKSNYKYKKILLSIIFIGYLLYFTAFLFVGNPNLLPYKHV